MTLSTYLGSMTKIIPNLFLRMVNKYTSGLSSLTSVEGRITRAEYAPRTNRKKKISGGDRRNTISGDDTVVRLKGIVKVRGARIRNPKLDAYCSVWWCVAAVVQSQTASSPHQSSRYSLVKQQLLKSRAGAGCSSSSVIHRLNINLLILSTSYAHPHHRHQHLVSRIIAGSSFRVLSSSSSRSHPRIGPRNIIRCLEQWLRHIAVAAPAARHTSTLHAAYNSGYTALGQRLVRVETNGSSGQMYLVW
ncbi:hypothetical protein Tco_0353269 [Tanacetum coccineum]